ncbi:DUF885 domain-containing protein [Marinicella sp. S1101]|uniref:DUF885 domain-containing protein n=1 Tax=Marinicella marina TaxID=2996016 RepID=UPI0022608B6D|nr:DUF885 domain-containing protein [Marinicella marina]MCX7553593.1 DUF885 domain-containing protein [Marinicella marina]MDJ1140217.1 DUF885 domain-containing protein [Marinicella marina]
MRKLNNTLALAVLVFLVGCKDQSVPDNAVETDAALEVVEAVQKADETITTPLAANFETSAITLFAARPHYATVLGVEQRLAGGYYNDRLDDYSPEAEAKLRAQMRRINQQLANLEVTDQVDLDNKKVMMNLNRYFAGNEKFPIGYIDLWMGLTPFIVSQINGPLIDVPNYMVNNHKISTIKDAEDYLKRLDEFDAFMQGVMAKLSADVESGWIAPKIIINKTIAGLEAFIAPEPKTHPLYKTFATQVDALTELEETERQRMLIEAEEHIANNIYAGYRMMIQAQQQLLEKATDESGIWAQPNGDAYYADAVKMLGDTDLTPEQIHQVGLDEVTRISAEMDAILVANGHTEGTVGERMLQINDDPQFLYEDSEAGRNQLLADLNGYIEEINVRMPEQFGTKPPYDVEVRAFPKAREASAPGGMYSSPKIDGSQPGIYWINLRDIKANAKFDLKTLTYHEANPGHHWQVALNLAQESLPMVRRIAPYNAYVEGWALYSELVAKEMGMYDGDPYGDLGRLKAELFRAVRLVVDTGLHHKKWSREEAIQYMAETTGTVDSDVVAEIERYMVWPGQALGYKLGMIKIVELRDMARKALGESFDIKAFHDLVLLGGAVPMAVLEDNVNAWVAKQQVQ